MKKVWYTLFFALFVLVLILFKPREDVVFGAISESEHIRLFEDGKDFVLRLKDYNTYTGTYTIRKDTVFLIYQQHVELTPMVLNRSPVEDNIILPQKLYINKPASYIKSIDNTMFSAEIYVDNRQKLYTPAPVNIRFLNSATAKISAVENRSVQ